MKVTVIILLILSHFAIGQNYFQQKVDYTINVTLDDKSHSLIAYEEFIYTNNSPNQLNEIYLHLWPNAYRNEKTALAKQLYENKDTELHFGGDDVRGFIDSLDFKVNGQKANWQFEENNIDIAIILLTEPLKPGSSLKISTPFYVKLPSGSISRLGHIGQSYQITQWYPKPAVYDSKGWHHMPYLNQGEFFSEYGSFDVTINLPKNYVVGATGDLQTQSEIEFLNERAQQTAEAIKAGVNFIKFDGLVKVNDFPASDNEMKQIRYVQKDVHDFAWFADKRFSVLKSEVTLPHSGNKVTSWAMYTPRNANLWKNASEYLNDAIYYYSKWNGDYPYKQVTAIDGTISAGGGMEYPNVTVIGNSGNAQALEVVIVHEVGHNWFYGQLGSNERVHGWMDEGMNTLNEVRYMQTKYPENSAMSDMVLGGRFHFNDLDHHDMGDISYRALAGMGEDQPIETHSARFTQANYGVVMYQKTGLVFFYLKDYLGEELFDKCMLAYYDEWEFKHPQPEDMRRSIEKTSGKDLSWLFDDLIQTTNHVDYKICSVKQTEAGYVVKTKNVGQVDGPYEINGIKDGKVAETAWVELGKKKSSTTLTGSDFDRIMIDYGKDIPELNRQNNSWKNKGLFKRYEPCKMEFLIGDNEPDATNAFWTPMIGGNAYDKFMIGVTVHNYGVPFNKFNYLVTPMYSVGRKMMSGMAEFGYTMLPKKNLKMHRLGLSFKSFKHDTTYRNNESYYLAIQPYWTAKIGNRGDKKDYSQTIRIQGLYRKDQFGATHLEKAGAYVEYEFSYTKPDHVVKFKLRDEYLTDTRSADQYSRILFETNYRFRYLKKKSNRWIDLRLFVGQQYLRDFNQSTVGYQYSMSLGGNGGMQDLFVDEYYFGRNDISGIWSQQRQENMGGFKTTSYYGTTAYGLATVNLYAQLPIPTGIFGIYADAGVFDNGVSMNEAFQFGAAIRIRDIFGVYFPIWMSKELNDSFGVSKYPEKIRFTLKMNMLNKPMNLSNLF